MEALYGNLKGNGTQVSCSVLCPGVVKTQMPFAYRNRPADLLNDIDVRDAPAERELQDRIVKAQQETGMEPEEVAAMVLEAIRDDQFWILTHPETEAGVMARAEDIVARRNLPSRPRSPGGGL
jgi:short-subunit dehydrogenase